VGDRLAVKFFEFGELLYWEGAIFERINCKRHRFHRLAVSFFAPGRPVFQGPIKQGAFKTDVAASFFALDPFVTKDLFAFG
jgi:hypothetical protein